MTKVYKVVCDWHKDGSFLTSCVMGGELQQEYVPNVVAECKVGGFLVFRSIRDVHEFFDYWNFSTCDKRFPIWECEAEDQVNLPPYCLSTSPNLAERVKALWQGRIDPLDNWSNTMEWPEGTLAFKKVTLRKRVK